MTVSAPPEAVRQLPVLDTAPDERGDAARNRRTLLDAAAELIAESGQAALTMDALARRAGVGKGTLFRRFGSRSGLMLALIDHSERELQAAIISGPPPLGPGADPVDRLVAFGRAKIDLIPVQGEMLAGLDARLVLHQIRDQNIPLTRIADNWEAVARHVAGR
jgi:AcrR family transcriptional regulator